jgi:SNF2 family DNA or RNA helicase
MVEQFQAGEADVFLISLKAGGTGLTLTNADTVIHYDPWWNPAVENQATDRAYRIGQDKPVFVHKLICKGSVEQRIQQMQERKSGISDSILTASLNQLKLDDDVLTNLLAPIDSNSPEN